MRRFIAIALFTSLSTASVHAEDHVRETMQVICDAQKQKLTQYERGALHANCSIRDEVDNCDDVADVHIEWNGTDSRWHYNYISRDLKGETKHASDNGIEIIHSGGKCFSHKPEIEHLTVTPIGRFSFRSPVIDIRPNESWFHVIPFLVNRTWHDHLKECLSSPGQWKMDEGPGDIIKLSSEIDQSRQEITVDLTRGANITRVYMYNSAIPMGLLCTFEWVDDEIGGYRLKQLTSSQFTKSSDTPLRKYHVDIVSFDPRPRFEKSRFSRESLTLAPGTRVETFTAAPGSQPKVSTIGKESKRRIHDDVLESLSQEAKENGLASPKRQDASSVSPNRKKKGEAP